MNRPGQFTKILDIVCHNITGDRVVDGNGVIYLLCAPKKGIKAAPDLINLL